MTYQEDFPVGCRAKILPTDGVARRLHHLVGEITGYRPMAHDGPFVCITLDGEAEDKPWNLPGSTWGLRPDQLEKL